MGWPYNDSELVALFEGFLKDRSMDRKRGVVFERDGWRCRSCSRSVAQVRLELDYIVSLDGGGTDDVSNLQTLCRDCSRRKQTAVHFN